jgi:BON domain
VIAPRPPGFCHARLRENRVTFDARLHASLVDQVLASEKPKVLAFVTRLNHEGRFADASVWVEGQRRWIFLKGCVRNKAQSSALARLVREVDDVEAVVDQLMIGIQGVPKYRTTGMVGR